MTEKQKLKNLQLEYEKVLTKVQNTAVFRYRKSYNQLYLQLEELINAFVYSDLDILRQAVLKIQTDFNKTLREILYSQVDFIQESAFEKFKIQLQIMLDIGLDEATLKKSLDLWSKKIPVKIDKKFISNRIWNINKPYFDTIKNELEKGLFNGISAKELSKTLKDFITSPTPQGRGIYRNAKKNAERLARTEIKRAYLAQEKAQIEQLPFIEGPYKMIY